MNDLNAHYRLLLGLDDNWIVSEIDLQIDNNQVIVDLKHTHGKVTCPACGELCFLADTAPIRSWRHLDTMQFTTEIRAAVPRCNCAKCGVKTVRVPWARKNSGFTLMFEAFAIKVLKGAANVSKAADILGLSWGAAHRIMQAGVQRGLQRRKEEPICFVGIDEKSFGKGHSYVSIMTDIDRSRVLEVVPDRKTTSADKLWKMLSTTQRTGVLAVAMDMWPAFMSSASKNAPKALIVHDRFHISKYLGEMVDKVRRRENRELAKDDDDRLKGLRQLLLYNEENLSDEAHDRVAALQAEDLKTGRAWSIKENFRHFWECSTKTTGKKYFDRWHQWAIRSQLQPVIKVASMLKRHITGLLSYFKYPITNAASEGFNSRIQSIKSAARGFRNFANYRTRILFYCGKLQLEP